MDDASAPSRLLLVEGVDDRHVVRHIRKKAPDMPFFEIVDKNGVENLLRAISVEVKVPGRTALGIMVDANTRIQSRWKSIAGRLRMADVALPPDMAGDGTIIRSDDDEGLGVKVGVWVMPNNKEQGQIEDFIAKLVPEEDPVWPLAQQYICRIPENHQPTDVAKATLHTWLAARRSGPLRMGEAIGSGELHLKGVDADRFASWLKRLFA